MKSINEYLLSKTHTKSIMPEKESTVEEIVKWIKSYGIEEKGLKDNKTPSNGKLVYVVGPGSPNDPRLYWVALRNHYGQNIVLKPKHDSFCSLSLDDYETRIITFDEAIELMIKMINNPNKPIEL